MAILILNFFIALIFITGSLQEDGNFKCATYRCADGEAECAKVNIMGPNRSNYVEISKCKNGDTCQIPGNPWQTLTYSQKDDSFTCIKETPSIKRLPGEACNSHAECSFREKNNACIDMKCVGSILGEVCQNHNECVVGLFCNKSGICAKQKKSGAECNNSYECLNSLLCGGGTCSVTPYSLQEGSKVDGDFLEEKCALGFVHNGQCSSFKQTDSVYSDDGFRRCDLGDKCTYSVGEGESFITKDCECGYNDDGYAYCPRGHDASKLNY
jgi:hypothetical protein